MFLKVELQWNVVIPAENLDAADGMKLQRSILVRLLDDFATRKATEDLGYLLAVTTMNNIGEGRMRQYTGDVLFPVAFTAITFKILKGEILEGVVQKVLKYGVFLRCGPIENLFLPAGMIVPDYNYVPGENPVFFNEKLSSKIEKDSVVRFVVIGTRWLEEEREFRGVVALDAHCLGPAS